MTDSGPPRPDTIPGTDACLFEQRFRPHGRQKGFPVTLLKKVALFGSYGWGNGRWMRDWDARMTQAGAQLLCESLLVNDAPVGDVREAFGAGILR